VYTAARYGIPYKVIEQTLATPAVAFGSDEPEDVVAGKLGENLQDRVNQSLLAFGTSADVPYGDMPRQRRDEVEVPSPTGGGKALAKAMAAAAEGEDSALTDPLGLGVRITDEPVAISPEAQTEIKDLGLFLGFDPTVEASSYPNTDLSNHPAEKVRVTFASDIRSEIVAVTSQYDLKRADDWAVYTADGHLFLLLMKPGFGGDGNALEKVFRVKAGETSTGTELSKERFETWVNASGRVCFGRIPVPTSAQHPDQMAVSTEFNVRAVAADDIGLLELYSRDGSFGCFGKESSMVPNYRPIDVFDNSSARDISTLLGPGFEVSALEVAPPEETSILEQFIRRDAETTKRPTKAPEQPVYRDPRDIHPDSRAAAQGEKAAEVKIEPSEFEKEVREHPLSETVPF
ncbi:MAG: hypothetical protein HRT45_09560, partial [Bdellovibrionales bacterium]|nr:hypothetical protein [Bdellovibrionales bacterium]